MSAPDGLACTSSSTAPASSPREFIGRLRDFFEEFSEPRLSGWPDTPQANDGLGPVAYHARSVKGKLLATKQAEAINNVFRMEKKAGDSLIKLQASLLCLRTGEEGPVSWLPAAQRVALRFKLRENTAKTINDNGLAITRFTRTSERVPDLIEYTDNFRRRPNAAELAVITEQLPRTMYTFDQTVNGPRIGARQRMPPVEDVPTVDEARYMIANRRFRQHFSSITQAYVNACLELGGEKLDLKMKRVDLGREPMQGIDLEYGTFLEVNGENLAVSEEETVEVED